MGQAVHPMKGSRSKRGLSTRAARLARLRERLEVETDPKVRAMIECQLVALERRRKP